MTKPTKLNQMKSPAIEIKLQEIFSNQFIAPAQVQLLRTGTFFPDAYGRIEITPALLQKLKENFDNKVRGIDIAIDYKHESEDIAAAWVKRLDLLNDSTELWATVEWTPKGKQKISEKEFRYLSADFTMDYQDNETLAKFGPTLLGAGLTNRPVIKGMAPAVELSEKSFEEIEAILAADDSLNACVSSLVPDLIAQGHDQKQAVAIAYSKCGENKMNELETLKAENVKLSEELGEMKKKLSDMPMSPEELLMKMKDLEDLIEKLKGENDMLLKEKEKMMQEKKLSELTSKFNGLLSEGKVCEAQRDAFMQGDAIKFAELAQPIKLGKTGTEQIPAQKGNKTAIEQIIELAEKKIADKTASDIGQAISLVLSENKELRAEYETK